MDTVLATLMGSVLGFLCGLFLAFFGGLHEPLHVFVPAMLVGALGGAAFLWFASRYTPRLSGWPQTLVRLVWAAGALGALTLFLGAIGMR